MKHPSDLPAYSKRRMFWEGRVIAALKALNSAIRGYTKFHETGMQ